MFRNVKSQKRSEYTKFLGGMEGTPIKPRDPTRKRKTWDPENRVFLTKEEGTLGGRRLDTTGVKHTISKQNSMWL